MARGVKAGARSGRRNTPMLGSQMKIFIDKEIQKLKKASRGKSSAARKNSVDDADIAVVTQNFKSHYPGKASLISPEVIRKIAKDGCGAKPPRLRQKVSQQQKQGRQEKKDELRGLREEAQVERKRREDLEKEKQLLTASEIALSLEKTTALKSATTQFSQQGYVLLSQEPQVELLFSELQQLRLVLLAHISNIACAKALVK